MISTMQRKTNREAGSVLLAVSMVFLGVMTAPPAHAADAPSPGELYVAHCAACHGADRFGITGPALLPENLSRLRRPQAVATITDGRPATQMSGFRDKLNENQIAALTDYIYTPPKETPRWTMAEIRASHVIVTPPDSLPAKPKFQADPLNLFLVVESGDHHITILDGDRFEPIHRFPTRFALHGGPKYSADGRFVYLASRDGWISKYDIYNLSLVAEVRVALNTRNVAVSADGGYVMAANTLPPSLVALDAKDLTPLKVIPSVDEKGNPSRVTAVYTAPPRGSFVATMKDIPEIWEIRATSDFSVGRIKLDQHVDDFFFDPSYQNLIGAARDGTGQVVSLTARRQVAVLPLGGMPHLASGITWERDGRRVLATPNIKEGTVSVIDMQEWSLIKQVKTLGPGFFMRSHENSPYAWVDSSLSKDKDTIQVIDKKTLEVAKTLRPAPGKTASHVEFTKDGRYALLSLWEMDGALVVYDAKTLAEIKRIPMVKPSGKYNVWNKIRLSEGTSH